MVQERPPKEVLSVNVNKKNLEESTMDAFSKEVNSDTLEEKKESKPFVVVVVQH